MAEVSWSTKSESSSIAALIVALNFY